MSRRPSALLFVAALLALLVPACAQGGLGDAGSAMDAATSDAGPRDAGRDARVSPPDSGPRDAGPPPVDSGPRDAGPRDSGTSGTCPPSSLNLAIVEIMIASQSGSGDLGEWFEVRNLGSCAINLAGLEIDSPTGGGTPVIHTVTSGLVTAGGFFVFAESGDAGDNHGLAVDYVYGSGTTGVVFNNSADSLSLRFGGMPIDTVSWTGSTDYRVGAARQLSRGTEAADNSMVGSGNWCDATNVYSSSGGTFLGTPGALNAACP